MLVRGKSFSNLPGDVTAIATCWLHGHGCGCHLLRRFFWKSHGKSRDNLWRMVENQRKSMENPSKILDNYGKSMESLGKNSCFSRHLQEDPDVFSLNSVFEAPHVCESTFPNIFLVN